jgi:hypothetical protein
MATNNQLIKRHNYDGLMEEDVLQSHRPKCMKSNLPLEMWFELSLPNSQCQRLVYKPF